MKANTKKVLLMLAIVTAGPLLASCTGSEAEAEKIFIRSANPDEDLIQTREDEQFLEYQELVSTCMARLGFDYIPEPVGSQPPTDFGTVVVPAELAPQFGYGIFVEYEGSSAYRPVFDLAESPNIEIVDLLDAEEAEAWDEARFGECDVHGAAAYRAASPEDAILGYFENELSALVDEVLSDRRVVEGEREWSECMAEKGYRFEFNGNAITAIEELLVGDLTAEELLEVQETERKQAAADASCPNNNFGGMDKIYDEVYDEKYREFARENEGAILAARTQGTSSEAEAEAGVGSQAPPPGNDYLGRGETTLQPGSTNFLGLEIRDADLTNLTPVAASDGISAAIEPSRCAEIEDASCFKLEVRIDSETKPGIAFVELEVQDGSGGRTERLEFQVSP